MLKSNPLVIYTVKRNNIIHDIERQSYNGLT